MKNMVCALVGLIIFVNQPGTVIVVGDLSVQEATTYYQAALSGAAGGYDIPGDNPVIIPESQISPARLNGTRFQLVGPKRGPVK